jgi:hypothetical protein
MEVDAAGQLDHVFMPASVALAILREYGDTTSELAIKLDQLGETVVRFSGGEVTVVEVDE